MTCTLYTAVNWLMNGDSFRGICDDLGHSGHSQIDMRNHMAMYQSPPREATGYEAKSVLAQTLRQWNRVTVLSDFDAEALGCATTDCDNLKRVYMDMKRVVAGADIAVPRNANSPLLNFTQCHVVNEMILVAERSPVDVHGRVWWSVAERPPLGFKC